MRYFSYIAEHAFKTAEDGKRLFYRGGPWSRPYVIPDAETEALLLKRQTTLIRCTVGPLIFGQPFLFAFWPKVTFQPAVFFGYMIVIMTIFGLAGRLAHRRLVSGLQRLEHRLPLRRFYQGMADKHSPGGLVLGFIGSMLFVLGGYWMLGRHVPSGFGSADIIGWFCISFFVLCAHGWGYALSLKLRNR